MNHPREIEGFSIGTDKALLALSDPPYYTACPNHFPSKIVACWQEARHKRSWALV